MLVIMNLFSPHISEGETNVLRKIYKKTGNGVSYISQLF